MTKKRRIICETLDETKKEVLKLVEQGVSFRDIVQIEFQIGDRIKHFSVGEISKIKNGSKGKENNSGNIDNDTALLFKEFNKGKKPIDLIIETKLNPDFVKSTYVKFMEFHNMRIVPAKFFYSVEELISRVKHDDYVDLEEDHEVLKDVVDWYLNPEDR